MKASVAQRILVVEDDTTLNRLLIEQLTRLGYVAQGAGGRAEALSVLARFHPALAILDLRLPDVDGLQFLPELREYCPVIILTAYGSIDQAVQVVRAGAADYLVKPVSAQSLELALGRFFDRAALLRDLAFWQQQARRTQDSELIGNSAELAAVRRLVSLFAGADAPVLILGEGGTGKELVARSLHGLSPRANGRMISVDCDGGLPATELFGELRETPEGGLIRQEGLIAAAETGTIYLSGADRLSPDLQARLLRAIETGTYRSVGSNTATGSAARFIVSSNLRLEDIATDGVIRNELLFRLSAFTIAMPALRNRAGDIRLLAEGFLTNRSFQRNIPKSFGADALGALERHDWPGNVRELRNAVERAIIMSAGEEVIHAEHLGLALVPAPADTALDQGVALSFDTPPTLDMLRDSYLQMMLEKYGGNRRRVAEILGISERNTYRLLQKRDSAADGQEE